MKRPGFRIPITTGIVSILFFAAAQLLLAQTDTGKIEGHVRDKETGAPLAGAQVTVEGLRLGNVTNTDGYYFVLNVPVGLNSITAQFTGYQKTTVSNKLVMAGQTATVNFELSSTIIALEGIVIETESEPLIVRDNTVTKQRQTAEEIAELPISNLDELIGLQGGVVSSGKHFSIRGGRLGEEAVYVDGVLMRSFGAEATMPPLVGKTQYDDLSSYVRNVQVDNSPLDVNANAVEEISIITGGFNAEYGSAKSGVINIVTREGDRFYSGNLRFRTDEALPRSRDFGFNELSGRVGGPIPLIPFAYFNVSTELQGAADGSPRSIDGRNGFRKVDQAVVDRINNALQGTPYKRASLDQLPDWGNPHPARRPGARTNRYSFSEKVTYSPHKNLKFLQTANISRIQRQHFNQVYSYRGGQYGQDHERGKAWSYLGGMDYTFRQTSSQNMTLQVRASYFRDESAMGQVYNPTGYYNTVEHHDPDELMELYQLNFGDLWNQPVNPDLSPVTHKEAIENFMFNDPQFANVPKLSLQGGIPVNWDLIPAPQEELLNFPLKDWVMTTEYWNEHYPLSGGNWDIAVPAIIDLRNVMTNDQELRKTYPYPLPGGPKNYYRGPLGLMHVGTWPAGYNINYGFRNDKKYNLKLDFDSQIDRYNRLKVGMDLQYFDLFSYTNGQSDYMVTIIDNSPILAASYVQDRFDLGDFVLDFGLRMEMLDPRGEDITFMGVAGSEGAVRLLTDRGIKKQYEFAPRLGVAFPVTDRTQVRFSYGKFYQPPSFRNLFRGDNIDRQEAMLEYSQTTMMETGFTVLLTDDLVLDCVGYNKDIVGDFTYRRVHRGNSPELFPAITNMDNGNVKGLDTNIQFKWKQYFNTRLTYSLQFARATGSDPIPSLNTRTLTLADPITQEVFYLPALTSPTDYDRTHKFNTQVFLALPKDFRQGTLPGKVFANTNLSFTCNLITGGPFNLGSSWDLVNRGRGKTSYGGNVRVSKSFNLGNRRKVKFFVDIHNLLHNRSRANEGIPVSVARAIFERTDDIFANIPRDYYQVDPNSGSYYWDNLHDLDKDGFVNKDEMRILLFLDNSMRRAPSGSITYFRVGTEFNF